MYQTIADRKLKGALLALMDEERRVIIGRGVGLALAEDTSNYGCHPTVSFIRWLEKPNPRVDTSLNIGWLWQNILVDVCTIGR